MLLTTFWGNVPGLSTWPFEAGGERGAVSEQVSCFAILYQVPDGNWTSSGLEELNLAVHPIVVYEIVQPDLSMCNIVRGWDGMGAFNEP